MPKAEKGVPQDGSRVSIKEISRRLQWRSGVPAVEPARRGPQMVLKAVTAVSWAICIRLVYDPPRLDQKPGFSLCAAAGGPYSCRTCAAACRTRRVGFAKIGGQVTVQEPVRKRSVSKLESVSRRRPCRVDAFAGLSKYRSVCRRVALQVLQAMQCPTSQRRRR